MTSSTQEWFEKLGQPELAYEPQLIPPRHLMAREGILVIEDWLRWAEEWAMLLRVYGGLARNSTVLELGCGLGRIAFPLRYILLDGAYEGFDIDREKIAFLSNGFHKAHPNFRFVWADVAHPDANPNGAALADSFRFPYPRNSFDLVFAAALFNQLLPDAATNYFAQTARVLKPGGRAMFSFFLLDNLRPQQPRPFGFSKPIFDFAHTLPQWGDGFAVGVAEHPTAMTGYRLSLIKQMAEQAGLELEQPPLPGLWSGKFANWVCAEDVVVLRKPA